MKNSYIGSLKLLWMFKADAWLRIIFFERDVEMSWLFIYVSTAKIESVRFDSFPAVCLLNHFLITGIRNY